MWTWTWQAACVSHAGNFFFQMLPFLWFLNPWISTDDVQNIWVLACFSCFLELYLAAEHLDLLPHGTADPVHPVRHLSYMAKNWFQQFPDTSAATVGSHKHTFYTRRPPSSCLWPQCTKELSHACKASRISRKKGSESSLRKHSQFHPSRFAQAESFVNPRQDCE